ncbi:MAG TPA: AmmeMemoRadiSam system radical SAM enzyme [Clostridiaceae bacterium]|nr:AmmeMemoRadiSam system radical SAM enzyme [Clostridiaceae bacterium]
MKLALYYNKIEDSKVQCYLCPHNCIIKPGSTGVCRARANMKGELYSLNYGKITAIALDPIGKKPLKNFHPGSMILSVGTFGCNLKCSFCQNWTIAHESFDESSDIFDVEPEKLVEKALELVPSGNIGIAYTYNEPSIWYEFVYDTAKLAREKGLRNVLVTNGFISREPLEELLPYIDAMNIDVKAYTSSFYSSICRSSLDDVKRTVEISAEKCHVEVTNLIIPGLNDSMEEIEELAKWLASVSHEIPLHLSRFFPRYKMRDVSPTPRETLFEAKDVAERYLKHVYLGNI